MIEVKDRIPRKPNRIRITPENGTPFYATWERADEPIEEGTPVNKLLFDSIDEGGTAFTPLDDIEIATQKITTNVGWTAVTFNRPLSGIPQVLTQVLRAGNYSVAVQNVTRVGCEVAVREIVTGTYYVATSSGATPTTSVTGLKTFELISAPVYITAIYDGGDTL